MKSSDHISTELLRRYVTRAIGIPADAVWAVEAHMEGCAFCRERLGDVVAADDAETTSLLARVQADLAAAVSRSPAMPARRWSRLVPRWAPPGFWPRVAMTALLIAAALAMDRADGGLLLPSLVLLLAPVAPLLGVAAICSAGLDPAHELAVSSPRAGFYMVLRRTFAMLLVVIPVLAVAGLLAGASPARWLLPCLAFTAGALALGQLIGLHRAAGALALAWTAGVIAPSLLTDRPPLLLEPVALPYWAGLVGVVAVVLVLRRDSYMDWRRSTWFGR